MSAGTDAPKLPPAIRAAAAAPRAAAGSRPPRDRRLSVCVQARRSSRDECEDVAFDDEEDWEAQVGVVMLHLAHWTLLPCRRSIRASTDRQPTDWPPAISPHSTLPSPTLPPPTPHLQGSAVQAPGFGPVVNTALRGLSAISERLTDFALQYAPADASPGVVRVAVNAGMLLLALSFVKSLLSVSGSEVGRLWAGECTLGDGNGGS